MTIEQILSLGQMGFTKEDIIKMANPVQQPPVQRPPVQQPPVQQPPVQQPPVQQPPVQQPPVQQPPVQQPSIESLFSDLTRTIQNMNIQNAIQNQPKPETVDDVINRLLG